MNTDENLRYYMDETSAPYPENECPYPRTEEDDAFDEMIIEKYHLNTEDFILADTVYPGISRTENSLD